MRIVTNRESQSASFVDNLYKNLRKKTAKAILEFDKFASLTKEYVEDGLEDNECIELLMIDGLTREASESYVEMIKNQKNPDGCNDYVFQYEDNSGRVINSQEVGKIIRAASEAEAWEKIEELANDEDIDFDKIISVEKI